MKKSIAPLVLMTLVIVLLGINSAVQAQSVEAEVTNIAVFIPEDEAYVTSLQGLVENNFTKAVITKQLDVISFEMHLPDSVFTTQYKIIKRSKSGRKMNCIHVETGNEIEIEQRKGGMKLHCQYSFESNRFKGAYMFAYKQ